MVFVAGAIPGDRVVAEVGKSKRAYAEARTVEIIEPSPERIPERADHPGAPWQVLPYERQLEVKQSQVDEALKRIGQLHGYELEPIVPALQQWRYRNKLEYSFGADASGRLICGFHAPGRWDEIVEVTDCLLASEAGNAARERVVEWCRAAELEPYDRRSGEWPAPQPDRPRGPPDRRASDPPGRERRPRRGAGSGRAGRRRAAVRRDSADA